MDLLNVRCILSLYTFFVDKVATVKTLRVALDLGLSCTEVDPCGHGPATTPEEGQVLTTKYIVLGFLNIFLSTEQETRY